jgi:hypothetical protein
MIRDSSFGCRTPRTRPRTAVLEFHEYARLRGTAAGLQALERQLSAETV